MTAEDTLWQHTLYCVAHHFLYTVLLCAKLCRCVETLSTWVTSIASVNLIGFLVACKFNLLSIDNDYIVSTINVWSKSWLVLSAKQLSDFRAETTNNLVASIKN